MYLVVVDNVQSTNSKMHVNLMFKNKCRSSKCFMGKHYVAQNSNVCRLTEISKPSRVVHLNEIYHFIFSSLKILHDLLLQEPKIFQVLNPKVSPIRWLSSQEREVGGVLESVWVCDNLMPSDKKIQIGLKTKFFLCIPSTYQSNPQ